MKNQSRIIVGLWLGITAIVAWLADSQPTGLRLSWVIAAVSGLTAGIFYLWRWGQQRLSDEREKLRQQQQIFIDRLHHQIKNPLQVIKLGLTNLNYRIPDEHETLGRLQNHAERISKLVSVLHQLYELDQEMLVGKKIQLSSLLEEEADLIQQTTGRNIDLRLQIQPWLLSPIYGDDELLRQAFSNLLENAVKYSNDDTPIELRANDDGKIARIEIIDCGIGILPEELSQIGEQLFRGSNTKDVQGSGLGLAMVKRIIELHSGKMEISSKVDQGTIVSVQLPVVKT